MKLQRALMVFLVAALVAATPLTVLAGNGAQGQKVTQAQKGQPPVAIDWDQDMLLFMREEEKLARDVYRLMYDEHEIPVFHNISEAEQSHMNALGQLVRKYGLTDPVTDDKTGEFTNTFLKGLYKELVYDGNEFGVAGLASPEAALLVGALVEELDISDLQDAIGDNPPDDVTRAYENLMNGSHNHLRAFVDQLERRGMIGDEGYTARVLTQDEVDAILDGKRGRGRKR